MTHRVLSGLNRLVVFISLCHHGGACQKVCHTERSPDVLSERSESKNKSGRSPRLPDGQGSAECCLESPSTSLADNARCAQADRDLSFWTASWNLFARLAPEGRISWPRNLLCIALVFLSSCASTKHYPPGAITIEGVIHRTRVEGGCWVFRTTDGQNFELAGEAAKDLLREGLRAEIVVKPRRDLKSICMVGKIVEVVEIKEIHSDSSPP